MASVRPANDLKRNELNDDEITLENSLVSLFTESWRSLLAVALSAALTFNHFQDRSFNQPQSNMFEKGGKLDYTDSYESRLEIGVWLGPQAVYKLYVETEVFNLKEKHHREGFILYCH